MSKVVGVDLIKNPDLLTQAKYAVPTLVLGMKQGSFTGKALSNYVSSTRVDFVNARRVVNGTDKAQQVASDAQNNKLPKVKALLATANTSTAGLADKKQPKSTVEKPKTDPAVTPSTTFVTSEQPKGNKLTVSIGSQTFEFYHQGTETSDNMQTKVSGKGVRWVLNRRTRNKTEKDIKLSELAAKIAKAHKVTLSYQAVIDPLFEHIDQTGLTDYQLLKRECDRAGLFLSEVNGTLTIKSLSKVVDTNYTAVLGTNLIGYTIKDAAIDTYSDDQGSSAGQADIKTALNPVTGQFEQKRLDIDPVKDVSSTGKDKPKATGTLAPGQDAVVMTSASRTKRVKGLPSTFVLPLDEDTLALTPMMAFRTKGLPGTFSRVWFIDSVEHSVSSSETTLECYSPVEVAITEISSPDSAGSGSDSSGGSSSPNANNGAQAIANIPYKNNKLLRAALDNIGMSSRHAPGTNGGRVACVWAVNQIFAKAGIPNAWNSSLAVKAAKKALQGIATKVPVSQALPGDVVLWDGPGSRQHIGIVLKDGATEVISNSSNAASWSWRASHSAVAQGYGGAPTEIYRLK